MPPESSGRSPSRALTKLFLSESAAAELWNTRDDNCPWLQMQQHWDCI
jgi:hypothetical protein